MPPHKSQAEYLEEFRAARADVDRAQREVIEAADRMREAAVGLYNWGLSYQRLGDLLGVSSSRAWQLVNPDKAKTSREVQAYKERMKAKGRPPRKTP